MTDFADLASFVALPRVTGLALGPGGDRLVVVVQVPDEAGARYVSALWEVPPDGGEPVRLTRSGPGDSAPAFRPDGSLVFVSARPDPDGERDEPALWVLPPRGEPRVLARSPGGLSGPVVARDAGTVLVRGSRLAGPTPTAIPTAAGTAGDAAAGAAGDAAAGAAAARAGGAAAMARSAGVEGSAAVGGSAAAADADRRRARAERQVTAILHTGMPVRHWDRDLGAESPRLFVVDGAGGVRDLAPDAGFALADADASISADGTTVATTWRTRRRGGAVRSEVVLIDVAGGGRTVLGAAGERDGRAVEHEQPRIAPDGTRVAMLSTVDGSYEVPAAATLRIVPVGGGPAVPVAAGDLWPTEWVWSADSGTLLVAGDRHGRGAVLAVDPATGAVRHTLADDAVHTALCPSPDGRHVYALRSAVDAAPAPVRLAAAGGGRTRLATPAPVPALPGRVEEVRAEVGGAFVSGRLCLPAGTGPAPLMLWVHGGPFASWNGWSWRWNPWVAVARGWAVLLPDPALSTGYGPDWIARAWPHRAGPVWADLAGLLDAVVARPDVDGSRTACLGASFGGYLTNWIAGHTDRFGAIVTHSGTWALDQKNDTADLAPLWDGWFGRPAEHPDWYAENSPHHFADDIRTPMLVVHGARDYRVPVGEALRLWWDLVRRWDGDPADLPHRFLHFPGENHWIGSPANAEVWYDTVLGFCGRHVRGDPWTPSALL